MPFGPNSRAKSSSGMAFGAPGVNGYRPFTAWLHSEAGPPGALNAAAAAFFEPALRCELPLIASAASQRCTGCGSREASACNICAGSAPPAGGAAAAPGPAFATCGQLLLQVVQQLQRAIDRRAGALADEGDQRRVAGLDRLARRLRCRSVGLSEQSLQRTGGAVRGARRGGAGGLRWPAAARPARTGRRRRRLGQRELPGDAVSRSRIGDCGDDRTYSACTACCRLVSGCDIDVVQQRVPLLGVVVGVQLDHVVLQVEHLRAVRDRSPTACPAPSFPTPPAVVAVGSCGSSTL